MVQGVPQTRWRSGINVFSASLLFLLKLTQNWSFEILASLFALDSHVHASKIFRKVLIFFFKNCTNLPAIYDSAGNLNVEERKKFYRTARSDAQPYFLTLADAFEDPSGRNRRAVPVNTDATYLATTTSLDLEHQKYVFYVPRTGHCTKLITICSMIGKFIAALPLCSSQSPSSGDAFLAATFMRLTTYLQDILGGDDEFFVILYTDAGFVVEARNMPTVLQNVETLAQICTRVHCVLLHTSDNHSTYHFERTPAGKLRKVPRDDDNITHSENVISFTRKGRKSMEQAHAGLKQKFKILDTKKLSNTYLQPFTERQRIQFGLDDSFQNVSKLSYIAIACLSLYNRYHPGFPLSFMSPTEQVRAARNCLDRIFLENPLHYDIWPFSFIGGRSRQWTDARLGDLHTPGGNFLNFPQCPPDLINPVAVDLTGGLNSLTTSDAVLTYKHQLALQGRGLTRDQILTELQQFQDDMRFQYFRVNTEPAGWDNSRFGTFIPVTLVRFEAPPSNKSATARQNFRWPIIAFSNVPSDRLGLRDPYRVILYWNCFNCPSKCGLCSFCKHLAALLKALSFPYLFKSTARGIDLLNSVVDDARQVVRILPSADVSAAILQNVVRRSQNTRTNVGGNINPLYDTSNSSSNAAPVTTVASTSIATTGSTTVPVAAVSTAPPSATPRLAVTASTTATVPSSSPSMATPSSSGVGINVQQIGMKDQNSDLYYLLLF